MTPLSSPPTDPTPLFEHFRGSFGSELLTAAVAHLEVIPLLNRQPLTLDRFGRALSLSPRAAVVLTTALRAMGILTATPGGELDLTPLARNHLVPGAEFEISGYIGLAASSPGVLAMVERLRSSQPARAEDSDRGAAFIFREGLESAMEQEESARRLTLALAGRARNVAPALAERLTFEGTTLLDVGGGTGIYAIACLRQHPDWNAIVLDRPEVLKVAREFAVQYGVSDRLECVPGNMFDDPLPEADCVLLSNILHDWDVPECNQLIRRCAESVRPGGRIVIHDVFLNDSFDGPLPVALYSAALFCLTEGRAYSSAEYRGWLNSAGLTPTDVVPTGVHCGLLSGIRPRRV